MEDINRKVNLALQQLLNCLHPSDSRWLKEKVQAQSLLSEFKLLLDQEELEMATINECVTAHPELQAYADLLAPHVDVSDKLRQSIRSQLLNIAKTDQGEAIHAN